jgi:Domain of unknown function (DUF4288)
MKAKTNTKWFWAWLIEMTVQKGKEGNGRAIAEVWKNLVILRASNAREAIRKARDIGSAEAGDCRGTLRLYDKPAVTHFLGIEDMGLIHDDLEDGAEILWRLQVCRQSTARRLPKSEKLILARLEGP